MSTSTLSYEEQAQSVPHVGAMAPEEEPTFEKAFNWKDALLAVLMVLLAIAFIFPFVWLIMTSLKPPAEVFSGEFFPSRWTTENYEQVFTQVPMWRWMGNTRSEEHTSELQSRENLVCRLLLEKKKRRKKVGCQ